MHQDFFYIFFSNFLYAFVVPISFIHLSINLHVLRDFFLPLEQSTNFPITSKILTYHDNLSNGA